MELYYQVDKTEKFSQEEKLVFLKLLKKQGQVEKPDLLKIEKCLYLCIAWNKSTPVGIGAIKNVYLTPFKYAKVDELKNQYINEIGYLYVENSENSNYRGLGIGKKITHLLLQNLNSNGVFATTENSVSNGMFHILSHLGFKQAGRPFLGKKTGKELVLMVFSK
jgi:hypothetical protein